MRTDPTYIRHAVDRRLERRETDYLDVLQIHYAKMEQAAEVEVLSGDAATGLDRAAGEIAARLRFTIDVPAASRIPGNSVGAAEPGCRSTDDDGC